MEYYVRRWNSNIWERISETERAKEEARAGKNSAFAEIRNIQTILTQFESIEAFLNYMNQ